MSWATCYQGSNNIHFNSPPLMDDGRNYSSFQLGISFDNALKNKANIKTNTEYRRYLQQNADSIIKNNQLNACGECGTCPYISNPDNSIKKNSPYIFESSLSDDQPYGYENSDLKNLYLSRNMLEANMHAPVLEIKGKEQEE